MRRIAFVPTLAGLLCAGTTPAVAQTPRVSFELAVPAAPTPVTVDGRPTLGYELHLTNLSPTWLAVTRIEVLDAGGSGRAIADLDRPALTGVLGGPGTPASPEERHDVPPGKLLVAYFWLALEASAPQPRALVHRVGFRAADATDSGGVVEGGRVRVGTRAPVPLGPPLRGGPWVAVYGPEWDRGHRRVLLALDGAARIPARFAIDWMKVDDGGGLFRGDGSRVADWHGYGAEALAVADATVAATRDSMPESATIESVRYPLADESGNYVVLNLGDGRFATYEHLRPGSVRVRVGERVTRGQVVAQLGYTGSSTGPHLHFHVSDGEVPLAGEGVPWAGDAFELLGRYTSMDDFRDGKPWAAPAAEEPAARRLELPGPSVVVRFPLTGSDDAPGAPPGRSP